MTARSSSTHRRHPLSYAYTKGERAVSFYRWCIWLILMNALVGRNLAYHYPSRVLLISTASSVYRLNLDQSRFLNSLATSANLA